MSISSPQIVVLDSYTLNPGDLSWEALRAFGPTIIYEHSTPDEIVPRAKEATILLVNKVEMDATKLRQLPNLQLIAVTATGYNNIDLVAAAEQGVVVCNAVGYGTGSVAQHVFALLLELTNRVGAHSASVHQGDWSKQRDFMYTLHPIEELVGKTMGIYGFGRIGQAVGRIAQAFGMEVIAHHKHPERDAQPGVRFVDLPSLFRESDVLSLHAPLTTQNAGIINASNLALMKPSAYLINTGRGGLVEELALKAALESGQLAGAGLDVLSSEPPPTDHPLYGVPNCIITPHNAWASRAARQRLLDIVLENIASFLRGGGDGLGGEEFKGLRV
ncbi:MAG: D-2-hydroxyacid dehydrogenase [Bacteroidota bacterium]